MKKNQKAKSKPAPKQDAFSELTAMCDERGITLYGVCVEMGVATNTFNRWNGKEPRSVELYKQALKTITGHRRLPKKRNGGK